MKQGQRVSFYVEKHIAGKPPLVRRGTGILISFDDYQAYVLPTGKTKAILLPINQVRDLV